MRIEPGDIPVERATLERIARVLRALEARKALNFTPWTNKYLERWRSIRAYMCALSGERAAALSEHDAVRVGAMFTRLSDIWDKWNPPVAVDRSTFRFPERSHFPNYNATFRALFKLLRISYDPCEWPMPSSERSLASINKYLTALFAEAQWPYEPFKFSTNAVTGQRVVE